MNHCVQCAYRTTIVTQDSKTVYSALRGADTTISFDISVAACGKSAGMPVQIPVDRVACMDYTYAKVDEE